MKAVIPTSILLLTLAGCATGGSSGPALGAAEIAEVETAIRAAEEAGAAERASELLDESRLALAAARRTSGDEARQRLLEARGYAAAAEAQARAERLRRDAERLRREADDLERRAEDIREEAGRPPGSRSEK